MRPGLGKQLSFRRRGVLAGRFSHLVPDRDDFEEDLLSSFGDLRRNTMRTLYGIGFAGMDKSPKGSVDVAIQPLVDLINFHPSFATLSSCSGRISLFDPQLCSHALSAINEEDPEHMIASGKGHGGWLLVSHDEVDPSSLSKLLDETNDNGEQGSDERVLIFKLEPLLLHVAASTIQRGRQLLNLALRLGFRESGLIVTTSKVTVAIRGHSLALSVPIARCGKFRPPNEYLYSLMQEANQRLSTNAEKLNRLTLEVEAEIFRQRPPEILKECNAIFHSLPRLDVWGHAAAAVPSRSGDVDVFVFGGYGRGPSVVFSGLDGGECKASSGSRPCVRLDRIYSLSRNGGIWNEYWTEIPQVPIPDDDTKRLIQTWYGVGSLLVPFTAREGLDACLLPLGNPSQPVIAIFGGRSGPSKPKNELLLYEPISRPGSFLTPCDVRGDAPSPRWGHTFTALTGKNGHLALLMGGRDDKSSLDSVHMLSIAKDEVGQSHLLWQKIEFDFTQKFHHSAVRVTDDNSLMVFGGLSDSNNVVEAFSDSFNFFGALSGTESATSEKPVRCLSAFRFENGSRTVTGQKMITESSGDLVPSLFATSSCAMEIADNRQFVAISGGTPNAALDKEEAPMYCFAVIDGANEIELTPYDINFCTGPSFTSKEIDFGSMVHHRAISVPPCRKNNTKHDAEMLLIGGGVAAFAFGASFSESYRVEFNVGGDDDDDTDSDVDLSDANIISSHSRVSVSTVKSDRGSKVAQETNVFYVSNKNAKALKSALENESLLDKTFRMTKADPQSPVWDSKLHIAVPVTKSGMKMLQGKGAIPSPPWRPFVIGTGRQEVPYSTAILGQK